MAIYVWLKYLQTMQVYETHEDLQKLIDRAEEPIKESIRNNDTIFIESDTKYWRN